MFGIPKEIRQMVERCIRDREGRIVGYLAGYSNTAHHTHIFYEGNVSFA